MLLQSTSCTNAGIEHNICASKVQITSLILQTVQPTNQGLMWLQFNADALTLFLVCALCICLSSTSLVRVPSKINSLLLLRKREISFLKLTRSSEGIAKCGLDRGFPFFPFSVQDPLFPTGVVPSTSEQSTSKGVGVSTYKRLCHCQSQWHNGQKEKVTVQEKMRTWKQTSASSFFTAK